MSDEASLLRPAIERFDALNARDPNKVVVSGEARPRELVQASLLGLERPLEEVEVPNRSDRLLKLGGGLLQQSYA